MSVAELARAVGVSRSAVYQWQSNVIKGMKPAHLIKTATVLGVTPSWLAIGREVDFLGRADVLPPRAIEVARLWMDLAPGLQERIMDTLREAVTWAKGVGAPVSNDKVAQAYGRPPKRIRESERKRGPS